MDEEKKLEQEEYLSIYKDRTTRELIDAGFLIDRLKQYKSCNMFVD